jgi:oligopeptide transport system substrate-binding protein
MQLFRAAVLGVLAFTLGCTNSPYPPEASAERVLYAPYSEAPKTLDPVVGYSTSDHAVTAKVYDTLLDYHYLKRPYELVQGLAKAVPKAETLDGGKVRYHFELREGLIYHDDACFSSSAGRPEFASRFDGSRRRIVADDFVFAIQRVFDSEVGSPVAEPFSHVEGLPEFGRRLGEKRKTSPGFAKLPISEQYRAVGPVSGLEALSERELVVTLSVAYPQILYWFAMPFSSPMPFEAVDYYDGEHGRPALSEHMVGSGPFILERYEKRSRISFRKNPDWYGHRPLTAPAPAARFPSVDDVPNLSPEERVEFAPLVGRALPLVERVELRREEEVIPAFNKFVQGYYDQSGIARESWGKVVHEGGLSAEMAKKGMRLHKSVVPAFYYIGFNLDDEVVGTKAGERSRLLRQAMGLATDAEEYSRRFQNGRGIMAETLLPPGIFGYDEAYKNPFRGPNLKRAQELLAQAGYPEGIDPKTGRPLKLTFDVADTTPESRVRFLFWTNQWRKLGIQVELSATNYNKFQEKIRDGAYQVFQFGWVADYPDPENFLFLLTTAMARSVSGGPNSVNFKNAQYDTLFEQMKTMESGPLRAKIISEMRSLVERERPWIELFHPEEYVLGHGWLEGVKPFGLSVSTTKYLSVDPVARQKLRAVWNRPIIWPFGVGLLLLGALVIPLYRTYQREQR